MVNFPKGSGTPRKQKRGSVTSTKKDQSRKPGTSSRRKSELKKTKLSSNSLKTEGQSSSDIEKISRNSDSASTFASTASDRKSLSNNVRDQSPLSISSSPLSLGSAQSIPTSPHSPTSQQSKPSKNSKKSKKSKAPLKADAQHALGKSVQNRPESRKTIAAISPLVSRTASPTRTQSDSLTQKRGQGGSREPTPEHGADTKNSFDNGVTIFKRRRLSESPSEHAASENAASEASLPSEPVYQGHKASVADDMMAITLGGLKPEFKQYTENFRRERISVDQLMHCTLSRDDLVLVGIAEKDMALFLQHFGAKEQARDPESSGLRVSAPELSRTMEEETREDTQEMIGRDLAAKIPPEDLDLLTECSQNETACDSLLNATVDLIADPLPTLQNSTPAQSEPIPKLVSYSSLATLESVPSLQTKITTEKYNPEDLEKVTPLEQEIPTETTRDSDLEKVTTDSDIKIPQRLVDEIRQSPEDRAKVRREREQKEARRQESDEIGAGLIIDVMVNSADQVHAVENAIRGVQERLKEFPEQALVQKNEESLPSDRVPIEGFEEEVKLSQRITADMIEIANDLTRTVRDSQAPYFQKIPVDICASTQTKDQEKTTETDTGSSALKYSLIFGAGAVFVFVCAKFLKK